MIVVQIGTNTGDDHVRQLCKSQTVDRIFLVEPFQIHNASIQKQYANVKQYTLDNIAIVPTPVPTVELYYTDMDGPSATQPTKSYEVASIHPQHLLKHNYPYTSLRKITVPALTLNQYLETKGLTRIDYLFLDIEGIDFEVLQTIDFNRFDIRNLQIEHLHLDKPRLIQFMASKGYSPTQGIDLHGYDTMFVKL